jgi:calcium-dependent protein kinase
MDDHFSAYYHIVNTERVPHKWPRGCGISDSAKDLVDKLLSFKWQDRPTAEEVLNHPWIRGESASDEAIGGNMLNALTEFQTQNKLKKAIAKALRNQMSEADKTEVKKLFDMFDVNKDGKLSADEIAAMMNYLGKPRAAADVLIKEADEDGDGGLDMDEMMALRATCGMANENLKAIFENIDKSGDGLIDALELSALCQITEAQAAELIAEGDSSGDGQIDLDEFLKVMGKMK